MDGRMNASTITMKIKTESHCRNPAFWKMINTMVKTIAAANCTSATKSAHHQNSERAARPSKSPYFFQQVRTASPNPMMSPLISVYGWQASD